jgi:alpha-D-ribose 1-methylphosphonate 5-triphosphate diphosphatase
VPGLVEVHTDNLERHVMPRPKVTFPMQAAVQAHDAEIAAAGITTVLDAIGVGDPYGDGFRSRDQSALLRVLDRLEGAARCVPTTTSTYAANCRRRMRASCSSRFSAIRRLRLISLMDHTPGQRQWTDMAHARVYYTGKKGWTDAQFDAEVDAAPRARRCTPSRTVPGSRASRASTASCSPPTTTPRSSTSTRRTASVRR